jgi:chondroitin AC lyase
MPVFNLWIDQGRAPQDETYQYIVIPNASAKHLPWQATGSEFEVLSNTKSIQAVYSRSLKLAEIAFREPGSLPTPLGEVKADHSCLLLVRQIANGWKLAASNPENQSLIINVAVQGKQLAIQLPDGFLAGSSIVTTIR